MLNFYLCVFPSFFPKTTSSQSSAELTQQLKIVLRPAHKTLSIYFMPVLPPGKNPQIKYNKQPTSTTIVTMVNI